MAGYVPMTTRGCRIGHLDIGGWGIEDWEPEERVSE